MVLVTHSYLMVMLLVYEDLLIVTAECMSKVQVDEEGLPCGGADKVLRNSE